MIGVIVLIVLVVLVLAIGISGMLRAAGRAAQLRRAQQRVRTALSAPVGAERQRAVSELARGVRSASDAEAGALVLACRQAFSRDVVPVLVAGLGHRDPAVAADARQALIDTGSPGLRAAWAALGEGGPATGALHAFLLFHPDWLFDRLVEDFTVSSAASVRRHGTLWREGGLQARLELMATGSDAIGAIRAREIARLLEEGATAPAATAPLPAMAAAGQAG